MTKSEVNISRTPHDIAKERIIAKVWAYVRNHQNSLDSERCCRIIGELADVLDEPRQAELQAARDLAARCRADLAKKTQQYNDIKREIARLKLKYEVLEDEPTAQSSNKKSRRIK